MGTWEKSRRHHISSRLVRSSEHRHLPGVPLAPFVCDEWREACLPSHQRTCAEDCGSC